jgi:acyl phosphate:glycerol-3-phosphate acyltransferase
MYLIFALLCIYLIGSIPVGMIISILFYDCDPTKDGSGNIGTTNVARLLGWQPALFTLIGDVGKGLFSVCWMSMLTTSETLIALAAITVTLGHCYSIFLRFSGGKGVATVGGVLWALSPMLFILTALVWVITMKITKKSSLSALVSAIILFPLGLMLVPNYAGSILLLIILIVFRHKNNIARLQKGGQ